MGRFRAPPPGDKRVQALDIVVEMKLVWMRAQPDRIDLLLPLVVEPGLDHVAGEYIAAEQESVIALETKAPTDMKPA